MTGWLLLFALRISLWLAAVALAWHVLRPAPVRCRRRVLLVGLAAVPLWAWLPETGDLGWRWLPAIGEAGAVTAGGTTDGIMAGAAAGPVTSVGGAGVGALTAALVGLWLLGSAALAVSTLVRWQRWRHLEARATPVAGSWLDPMSPPSTPLPLPVAVLPGLLSPCVSGLVRPRLLVPPEALHWSADEWRAMVRHEWQHVCQGDLWWGWWMRCLRIGLWWHPLLHGLVDRWQEESELCCDQAAVGDGGRHERRVYAQLLMRLVEGAADHGRDLEDGHGGAVVAVRGVPALSKPDRLTAGAGQFRLRGERCLRRRLEQVLRGASPRLSRWQQGGRWLLVVTMLAAGGCGAASRPDSGQETMAETEAQGPAAVEPTLEAGNGLGADQDGAAPGPGAIDLADEARLRWAAEAFPAGRGGVE